MKKTLLATTISCLFIAYSAHAATPAIQTSPAPISTLSSIGQYQGEGAEIVAHDKITQRLYITDSGNNRLDIIDIHAVDSPLKVGEIILSPFGAAPNSVAVHDGVIAVAVEANSKTDPGSVVFFDADGNFLSQLQVGALPDMVTFTPNGRYLLSANEGEPNDDYTVDPQGSISIIDLSAGIEHLSYDHVNTASFEHLNGTDLPGVRIFGPGATVAQDLEPEYITVSKDSKTAYVTLQENNALAIVDIASATVTEVVPFGLKNHSLMENAFDASNKDGMINIQNWPTLGMYQPDAISSYSVNGKTYLITANEGDSRDYAGYSEELRVKDLTLNSTHFPNATTLQLDENLGRLKTTSATGDHNSDGQHEAIYSYGARSFSIWDSAGNQVFDSGDQFEQIIATMFPADFNTNNDENAFDSRSDDKGPEPEGVAIGSAYGHTYAFIGLERIGGVMVYEVSNPHAPIFVQYLNDRDFSSDPELGGGGNLAPEGVLFIRQDDSPTGKAMLVVSYEVSGTTTLYQLDK